MPAEVNSFETLRLLVVSPLAKTVGGPDRKMFLNTKFQAVTPAAEEKQLLEILSSERSKFDVVIVDLMWNDMDLEWTFDGLDVLRHLEKCGREEVVLLACQGHGFERSYLEEGRDHRLVRGMALKSQPEEFLKAIQTIATGGKHYSTSLTSHLKARDHAIDAYFSKSRLVATIAGAIARGKHSTYKSIAKELGSSVSNVEKLPALFTPILQGREEMPTDQKVTQSAVFRWCGEHAHYIVSWCRRKG